MQKVIGALSGEQQESAANCRNTGRAPENRWRDQKDTEDGTNGCFTIWRTTNKKWVHLFMASLTDENVLWHLFLMPNWENTPILFTKILLFLLTIAYIEMPFDHVKVTLNLWLRLSPILQLVQWIRMFFTFEWLYLLSSQLCYCITKRFYWPTDIAMHILTLQLECKFLNC